MEPMDVGPEATQDTPEPEVQVDEEQARSEAERKKLAAIREQAQRASERHGAYLQAKDAATAAKAQWESAVETLQDMCLERDEALPLLDSADSRAEAEAWRDVRLEALDPPIKPHVLAKLQDAGLETVGAIANHAMTKDLLEIDGIGEAAKSNIEDALAAFWEQRGVAVEERKPAGGGQGERSHDPFSD